MSPTDSATRKRRKSSPLKSPLKKNSAKYSFGKTTAASPNKIQRLMEKIKNVSPNSSPWGPVPIAKIEYEEDYKTHGEYLKSKQGQSGKNNYYSAEIFQNEDMYKLLDDCNENEYSLRTYFKAHQLFTRYLAKKPDLKYTAQFHKHYLEAALLLAIKANEIGLVYNEVSSSDSVKEKMKDMANTLNFDISEPTILDHLLYKMSSKEEKEGKKFVATTLKKKAIKYAVFATMSIEITQHMTYEQIAQNCINNVMKRPTTKFLMDYCAGKVPDEHQLDPNIRKEIEFLLEVIQLDEKLTY